MAQALLDVYTIKRELGRLENLTVALVGDLANGRTARSLAYLLSMYKGVKLIFVAPPVVAMGEDIKDFLTSRGVEWSEAEDLAEVRAGFDQTELLLGYGLIQGAWGVQSLQPALKLKVKGW